MAGILDEVMDGMAAKAKETPEATAPVTTQGDATPPAAPPAEAGGKPMNTYCEAFKGKYGGRNAPKKD